MPRRTNVATNAGVLNWERVRGRCNVDDPAVLPPDMAAEAWNWILTPRGLGQKRYGCGKQLLTGATFTDIRAMARFVPGQDESAAELHLITIASGAGQFLRVAGGTSASVLPVEYDMFDTPPISWACGNGKLFWAYNNATGYNRLHCYDPNYPGKIRRCGIVTPGIPNVTAGPAGSLTGLRTYRYQLRYFANGKQISIGNLGTATQSLNPAGMASLHVSPTAQSEYENQWRLFAAGSDGLYYAISGWLPLATAFDDATVPPYSAAQYEAAPEEGSFFPLPSAKFILWDGTHLLLFGQHASDTASNDLPRVDGRVYITRALDSIGGGEDECIQMSATVKSYVDLNRNGNAEDRAMAGPVDGNVFVFQSRGIFMLKPTGAANRIYTRVVISRELGAVSDASTFVGEDENGRPCVYWLDPDRGPYRYGYDGLQWCGYDVKDLWDSFAPGSTADRNQAHGVFDPLTRRCYWWIPRSTDPIDNHGLCFAVKEGRPTGSEGVRYGWTRFGDYMAMQSCSVLFAATFGSPMARKLKPYAAGFTGQAFLLRCDDPAATDDAGVAPYGGFIRSKAWLMSQLPQLVTLDRAWIWAPWINDAVIYQSLMRNYGDEEFQTTSTDLVLIGDMQMAAYPFKDQRPIGVLPRSVYAFEDAQLAGAFTFQTQLGDLSPGPAFFAIDRWQARMTVTDLEVVSAGV